MESETVEPHGLSPQQQPPPPGGSGRPMLPPEVLSAVRIFMLTTIVLCVFIFLGNLSILVALRLDIRLRETAGQLICSLTSVDLFVGVTMLIDHTIFLNSMRGSPDANRTLFAYRGFNLMLGDAGVVCSMLHVLLIGFDRLLTITRPLHYPILVTEGRTYAAIGLCCAASLACGAGFWAAEQRFMMLVRPAIQTTMFVLCVLVLCICYGSVVAEAIRHRRRIAAAETSQVVPPATKGSAKRSRLLFTVIGLFVILWMPQIIFNVLYLNGMQPKEPFKFVVFTNVTKTIAMVNSGVNIIIYSLLNKRFRNTLFRMLRGRQPNSEDSFVP